jgi:SAM-dependent methyltransferase
MTEHTCLVCHHTRVEPYLDILLKCPSCGFVTARRDADLDLSRLYGEEYFCGSEYLDYAADEAFFKKNFRKRLNDLLRQRSGGRLLEIGSAYGFFLDLARHHFDVFGYEVNAEGARYGRGHFGVDIRTADFLEATLADTGGPIDIAVMWDVIEHLERPDRFVAHIADLSAPNALLCLTTADIGSRVAQWRGRQWRMIHPPTHLHYFDRSTITRLLANHGFRVVEIRSIGVARSFRQILYSLFVLHLKMRRVYTSLHRAIPAAWGLTINTRDIMLVMAEKTA